VTLDRLLRERVLDINVVGQPVVLWTVPGVRSALDAGDVASGRESGATAAFEPVIDGRRLHFRADGAQFVDQETGSQWDLLGRSVGGPLAGKRLPEVVHVDTFWFAWAAFAPDTDCPGDPVTLLTRLATSL